MRMTDSTFTGYKDFDFQPNHFHPDCPLWMKLAGRKNDFFVWFQFSPEPTSKRRIPFFGERSLYPQNYDT